MSEPGDTDSAQRAQQQASEMGTTADDERDAQEHVDHTGEPERDSLGNQEGAS